MFYFCVYAMIQVRLSHSAHADMCACGPLSYPAGPACWQSGCLSSVSGTSPSKQTWSEVGRDHEARPEISEKTTRRDEDRESTCGIFFWLILKLLLTWLNVKNYMQRIFFLFETSILCFCFSPGRPLYSCAAVFFPWEVSFASLPPPPSPEPEYAPQNI